MRLGRWLAQLALVSQAAGPAGGLTVHDVVRDFLRAELGQARLAGLAGMLLDAVAGTCPQQARWIPRLDARRGWPGGNWATRTGTCGTT
jgi:hypothetical protein